MRRPEALERIAFSAEELAVLRRKAQALPEIVPFAEDPQFFARLGALGIQREVGTRNDELARFVFDAGTGLVVPRESLRAELVRYRGRIGVRIEAIGHPRLELRFPGIQALLHPELSYDASGELRQLVVFPESIRRIAALAGLELAFVRPWALNTIFALHPAQDYYLTNIYELRNQDALRFARLVEQGRLPFLGTHDLAAHVAGSRAEAWGRLRARGAEVRAALEENAARAREPWIGALILPYIAGILLDDLAQPPVYDAETRARPLAAVLDAIRGRALDPGCRGALLRYPGHHERLIRLARFGSVEDSRRFAREYVARLVDEIRAATIR